MLEILAHCRHSSVRFFPLLMSCLENCLCVVVKCGQVLGSGDQELVCIETLVRIQARHVSSSVSWRVAQFLSTSFFLCKSREFLRRVSEEKVCGTVLGTDGQVVRWEGWERHHYTEACRASTELCRGSGRERKHPGATVWGCRDLTVC